MENLRKYGKAPFSIVVVHGGPGAAGEMVPVAQELKACGGILEPLQTANSIEGQIEELKCQLEKNGDLPVVLIGFSWGAWLSILFTVKYQSFVKKLILIGSGPFEEKYAGIIEETRLSRLTDLEKKKYYYVIKSLIRGSADVKTLLNQLESLLSITDCFNRIEYNLDIGETIEFRSDIFQSVSTEAAGLRRSGILLEQITLIQCPLIAIHGDFDPHPSEGVREPLSKHRKTSKFILLDKCGHRPWIEKQAQDEFYKVLKHEIVC